MNPLLPKIENIKNSSLQNIIQNLLKIDSENEDLILFLISLDNKPTLEIQEHLQKFFINFKKKIHLFEKSLIEAEKHYHDAEDKLHDAENKLLLAETILKYMNI